MSSLKKSGLVTFQDFSETILILEKNMSRKKICNYLAKILQFSVFMVLLSLLNVVLERI